MSDQFLQGTHICAADGSSRFSNPEGRCKACAPFYTVFESILLQVGGVNGFSAGVQAIIEARQSGRRGDSVQGRVTRTVLNAILKAKDTQQLIRIYQEFLGAWDIRLTPQVEGMGVVWYHDYTHYKAEEAAAPVVQKIEDVTGWRLRWQDARTEKRERRETVRGQRVIVCRWQKGDERGEFNVGQNTADGRERAAEVQERAIASGHTVSFILA
jgi:hypothetical protein